MAEAKEEASEDAPKKPASKRTRAAKSASTEANAAATEPASSPSAESEPPEADAAKAPRSEDLWDQTTESLSKVDWGLRGRHLFRLVLMLFAAVAAEISVFVIYFLTAVHFLYTLITGNKLDELTAVCSRFSAYVKQLLDFISYRSDEPLFPFAPFPDVKDQPDVKD